MLWTEPQGDFLAGFHRFINGIDELQALSALKSIDQLRRIVQDAVDHMFVVRLMAKSINVWRINREFLHDLFILGLGTRKCPHLHLIDRETADLDAAAFSQHGNRSLEIPGPSGRGGLDYSQ